MNSLRHPNLKDLRKTIELVQIKTVARIQTIDHLLKTQMKRNFLKKLERNSIKLQKKLERNLIEVLKIWMMPSERIQNCLREAKRLSTRL